MPDFMFRVMSSCPSRLSQVKNITLLQAKNRFTLILWYELFSLMKALQ